MEAPATALLYLYITLASIDGEVEGEELKAAGTRLAGWGVKSIYVRLSNTIEALKSTIFSE